MSTYIVCPRPQCNHKIVELTSTYCQKCNVWGLRDAKLHHTKALLAEPRSLSPGEMPSEIEMAGWDNSCMLRMLKKGLGYLTYGQIHTVFLQYAPEDAILDYYNGHRLEDVFLNIMGNIYDILFIIWFRTGDESGCVIGANGNFNSNRIVHVSYEFAMTSDGREYSHDMFPDMPYPLTEFVTSVWHYEPWRNMGKVGRFFAMPATRVQMPAHWVGICGFIAEWANRKLDALGFRAVTPGQNSFTVQQYMSFYNTHCLFDLSIDKPSGAEIVVWNGVEDEKHSRILREAYESKLLNRCYDRRPKVGDILLEIAEGDERRKQAEAKNKSRQTAANTKRQQVLVSRRQVDVPAQRRQVDVPVSRRQVDVPVSRRQVDVPAQRRQVDVPAQRRQVDIDTIQRQVEADNKIAMEQQIEDDIILAMHMSGLLY
jgi:hypothetical protein